MHLFDEQLNHARLSKLDRSRKTAFAAACAQRLMPLHERYTMAASIKQPDQLADILDKVWLAVEGSDLDLSSLSEVSQALVPGEEDPWYFELGYAQNAAAAVFYAIQAWTTDDPFEAACAATHLYDAADYAAQRALDEENRISPISDDPLLESSIVQAALSAIDSDLTYLESGKSELLLRAKAIKEGVEWAAIYP